MFSNVTVQLRELHLVDEAVRGGGLGPLLAHRLRTMLVSLHSAADVVHDARITDQIWHVIWRKPYGQLRPISCLI